MKKLFCFLCFSLTYILAYAQSTYFNKRYDFYNSWEVSWNIIQKDSSYYLSGGAGQSQSNFSKIGCIKINSNGDTVFKKIYGTDSIYFSTGLSGAMIETVDSCFIMAGSTSNINSDYNSMLFKINTVGDSLWCKIYDTPAHSEIAYQIKQLPGRDFIICGVTDTLGNDQGLLMRTDSLGNIIWKKTYGNGSDEMFCSVDIMQDGSFIASGYRTNGINYVTYVVKTDASGNSQWQQFFSNDGGCIVACSFIEYSIGWKDYTKLYLIKLSSSGALQWQQKYGAARWGTFPWIVYQLPDSNFIITGNITDTSATRIFGLVAHIKYNGDSIFNRNYQKLTGQNSENYLRDIKQTPDGGFVACGFVAPLAPDTGTQDMWVIKLDSMGCDTANCQTNTGIFNHTPQTVEVTVYPNPATNSITISTSIYLQNTELIIYDLTGKEIYRKQEDILPKKQKLIPLHFRKAFT